MTSQTATQATPAEQVIAKDFAERSAGLNLPDTRQAQFSNYAEAGLPHRRIEEWKYTDLRAKLRELAAISSFSVSTPDAAEGVTVSSLGALDGASDLAGIAAERFRGYDSPMIDLTASLADAGVVIDVADGAKVSEPLRVAVSQSAKTRCHGASVYRVGEGAEATIFERIGDGAEGAQALYNAHVQVADNATLTLVRHIDAGNDGAHIGSLSVTLGAEASFNLLLLASSGEVIRTDVGLRFLGEHSNADLRGLHLVGGTRHVDSTMFVDHAVPNCESRELFKSVLDDNARSVFQGKILVRQDAQKTDGKMMTQTLMLSDKAEMDSKPELEIYADDVQCGHGATIGQIDDELLFYLMARGIPRKTAQSMLVSAFANEVFDDLDEAIAEEFGAVAEGWLQRHLAG